MKNIIILVLVLFLIGGGIWFLLNSEAEDSIIPEEETITGTILPAEGEPTPEEEAQTTPPDSEYESTSQEPDEQDECSTDEECETGYGCIAGICQLIACQPDCVGKTCGDDGCGGSCGVCEDIYLCQAPVCQNGVCIYANKANEMPCGDGMWCMNGECVCQPDCVGKTCGDDGCGGSCGVCDPIYTCVDGSCIIPILDM